MPKLSKVIILLLKLLLNDEVDFLHADKHESFLQIDTMIFDGCGQGFQNFPK